MTTPAMTSTESGFTSVRYFTQNDPYFYTVDNRPLTDLDANAGTLAMAVDSGRRAAFLNFLFQAVRNESNFGSTRYVEGLAVSSPSANTVRVSPGSIFEYLNITASDSRNIMKQAILPGYEDFAINTVSLTGAQSVIYAIEGRFTDFSASTSSTFPGYDNTNTSLPAVMLFGELELQIVAGSAAASGSEAAPATTSGWFQIFLVTVDGASPTTYSKVTYPASPSFNSWGMRPQILSLTNQTSTSGTIADMACTAFADASTQGAFTTIPLINTGAKSDFNFHRAIKFKVHYTSSVSSNDFAFRVKYQFLGASSSLTASYTTLTQDVLAAGTADQLQVATLTNGVIPAPGVSSRERVNVVFERVGGDAADTNTGILRVLSIQAFQ